MASEKGVVVGKLTFTEDGDPIDCSRMGVGGKAIPPNVDKVTHAGIRLTILLSITYLNPVASGIRVSMAREKFGSCSRLLLTQPWSCGGLCLCPL